MKKAFYDRHREGRTFGSWGMAGGLDLTLGRSLASTDLQRRSQALCSSPKYSKKVEDPRDPWKIGNLGGIPILFNVFFRDSYLF